MNTILIATAIILALSAIVFVVEFIAKNRSEKGGVIEPTFDEIYHFHGGVIQPSLRSGKFTRLYVKNDDVGMVGVFTEDGMEISCSNIEIDFSSIGDKCVPVTIKTWAYNLKE